MATSAFGPVHCFSYAGRFLQVQGPQALHDFYALLGDLRRQVGHTHLYDSQL